MTRDELFRAYLAASEQLHRLREASRSHDPEMAALALKAGIARRQNVRRLPPLQAL